MNLMKKKHGKGHSNDLYQLTLKLWQKHLVNIKIRKVKFDKNCDHAPIKGFGIIHLYFNTNKWNHSSWL